MEPNLDTFGPVIPGKGPEDPRIAIVARAPGRQESLQGKPFVGQSGKLLTKLLEKAGIDRRDCYLTHVVKRQPPNNNFRLLYHDYSKRHPTDYLLASWEALKTELAEVMPNLVIVLGGEALRALTDKKKITDWRGSVIQGKGYKILATFHPSHLFKQPDHQIVVKHDFLRAFENQGIKPFVPPEYNFKVVNSPEELENWLKDADSLTFDLETFSGPDGPHPRCVGLAKSNKDSCCIPFSLAAEDMIVGPGGMAALNKTSSYWTPMEEVKVLQILRRVLEDPDIPKYAQNFTFDATILGLRWGIIVRGLMMDTMHCFHLLWPELPKKLDFLASIYTEQPYYADYAPESDVQTWEYNQIDCLVTNQVAEKLRVLADEMDQWNFYKNWIEPSMYGLARMMNRGVIIDPEAQKTQADIIRAQREKLLQWIQSIGPSTTKTGKSPGSYVYRGESYDKKGEAISAARYFAKDNKLTIKSQTTEIQPGPPLTVTELFNPDGSHQVQEYLYKTLGLPEQRNRVTQKTSADEESLKSLNRKEIPDEARTFIRNLLDYRGKSKTLQFLTPKLDWDGRIRTSYNVSGTVNGRLSSSKSIFGSGANLQQQPNDEAFRAIFRPDSGHVWVKVDLSAAEARVVAWDAGLTKLRDRFLDDPDFDIHRWNASNIYGIPETDVTRSQRARGKVGVHGGNYGLGPTGASAQFDVPFREAADSLNAYKKALPQLKHWWARIDKCIDDDRLVVSPLGRRRTFLGRRDHTAKRSGYSFIPQSVVADIINRAVGWAEIILEPYGAYPLLQVHDEIDFSVPFENLDTCIAIIRNIMEPPIRFRNQPDLIIPCDVSTGRSWGETKEIADAEILPGYQE